MLEQEETGQVVEGEWTINTDPRLKNKGKFLRSLDEPYLSSKFSGIKFSNHIKLISHKPFKIKLQVSCLCSPSAAGDMTHCCRGQCIAWKTSTVGRARSVTYCPVNLSAVGQKKQQLTESSSHQDYICKWSVGDCSRARLCLSFSP